MESLSYERSYVVHDNEQKQYLKKMLLKRFDIEMIYNLKGKQLTTLYFAFS